MKKIYYFAALMVLTVTAISGWSALSNKKSTPAGFAVIELFTSEGCSSCPAADEALSRIADDYKQNVYVMEFHVDYWNRLGWKDSFSSAAYSERQRQYAGTSAGDGVYTPQAIINGSTHLVGSDEKKIRKDIDELLASTAGDNIELTGKDNGNHFITMTYSFDNHNNNVLNVALVQLKSQTKVRAGENNGHTLKHIHIVRDFKTETLSAGSLHLAIPEGMEAKDCGVIAYSQNSKTHVVTGAASYSMGR
ncbi:MAG: DUF1223 domain-containing protein [Chitinophagaceae bacterium]|nr:DUF1223 domain-containing protein [Chitinophagaceae bacterium]